ncbi:MAG: amidohydrolase [Flavobacteriales bacterium]|nr:amidohydrolase [Flavobacteriales bacterium]MCX7650473.1 amidohydrolase [Flavobacteriales bacterium]MDW8432527.1 amidohydrolase family protein [Flavobacteriales bacterium]
MGRKIDIHTHIMPQHMPRYSERFGYEGFVHLHHHAPCKARMMVGDKFFREIEHNCWDGGVRVQEMDEAGVRLQVLSTIPVLFNYWARPKDCLEVCRYLNDHMADTVARYPGRFVALATLPMQDPQLAVEELERCILHLGMVGAEIGTHINDWNLNEPELYPFWEACQRLNASVLVHPWDMPGSEKMRRYWLPWLVGMPAETSRAICSMIFGGIFEKFPRLRVAFCHGGGSFPGTLGRIEHGFRMRPDLVAVDNEKPPSHYLGRFWVDTLTFDPAMLRHIVQLFGSRRVAVGSDYPFPLGEERAGALVESMEWPEDIKEDLFFRAALEWLPPREGNSF